jgi:hypothetical protein
VIAAAARYEEGGEVRIPGLARCIVGTKEVTTAAAPAGA